ncbi:unnamed protein product, partial [Iphiclides podalirius]
MRRQRLTPSGHPLGAGYVGSFPLSPARQPLARNWGSDARAAVAETWPLLSWLASNNERSAPGGAVVAASFSRGIRTERGGVSRARLKMAAIRRGDAPRARASCRRRESVCVRWAGVLAWRSAPHPPPAPLPTRATTFRNMCGGPGPLRRAMANTAGAQAIPRRKLIACLIKAPDSRGSRDEGTASVPSAAAAYAAVYTSIAPMYSTRSE